MAAPREVGSSSMGLGSRVIAQGYKVLDEERHAVDYRPSVWGDHFIKNPTLPHTNKVRYDTSSFDLCTYILLYMLLPF